MYLRFKYYRWVSWGSFYIPIIVSVYFFYWCMYVCFQSFNKFRENVYFSLAQAACVRHACLCAPCVAWPLFSPSFSLSLLFFFFFFSLSFFGGVNFFSYTGDSPKWVKSKRRRKRERAKVGDNNGQATHGAHKHAWRTQAAWANY